MKRPVNTSTTIELHLVLSRFIFLFIIGIKVKWGTSAQGLFLHLENASTSRVFLFCNVTLSLTWEFFYILEKNNRHRTSPDSYDTKITEEDFTYKIYDKFICVYGYSSSL